MLTARQFTANLKQFGRHREFCTDMVEYALHHAMLHGQKTPWNELHAVVPRGLRAAMGKDAPGLSKTATAESVREKAEAIVAKFWEAKQAAKQGAEGAERNQSVRRPRSGTKAPEAPTAEEMTGAPMDTPEAQPEAAIIDGDYVTLPTACTLTGLDGVAMELSVDEYEAALQTVMLMRMEQRVLKAA